MHRQDEISQSRDSIRTIYDNASAEYSRKFVNELDHKPADRELLKRFADTVGLNRPVLDLGCGPGHTTAHLASLGLLATGVDLSPKMIAKARENFPQSCFKVGDFFALPNETSSVCGILAFYCIVHLTRVEIAAAFREMFRVLSDGGVLLLSFHVGTDVIRAPNFLDTGATIDFTFFEPTEIEIALRAVGFNRIEARQRKPYDTEYSSERCYIFAHKKE